MSQTSYYKNNGTAIPRIACAIIFCTFSFLYLYFYQADILYAAQHVLSHGVTTYNPLVGAILITLVLYLLHFPADRLTRMPSACHSLSYLPSFLFLTLLTAVGRNIDKQFSFGAWAWVVPLVLLLWYAASRVLIQAEVVWKCSRGNGFSFAGIWQNVAIMGCLMFLTGLFSNSNDVFHYRMHAENRIMKKDYTGALACGIKSSATDSSLTMLRAYALSCSDQLADSLFIYPLCGGSKALLPDGTTTRSLIVPQTAIRSHYRQKKYAADYRLMSLLLDKKIDEFARTVGRFYTIDESLPRHYREALVLYTHLRSNPVQVFHEPVMDTDYQDLLALQRTAKTETERKSLIRSTYGNTYWCYYLCSE